MYVKVVGQCTWIKLVKICLQSADVLILSLKVFSPCVPLLHVCSMLDLSLIASLMPCASDVVLIDEICALLGQI